MSHANPGIHEAQSQRFLGPPVELCPATTFWTARAVRGTAERRRRRPWLRPQQLCAQLVKGKVVELAL